MLREMGRAIFQRRKTMDIDKVIRPDRIRSNEGSFAFIPHRFLRGGFWQELTPGELCLYVLLVLVADRNGMSCYGRARLASLCRTGPEQILEAVRSLRRKDLICLAGMEVQVLSLPPVPLSSVAPPPAHRDEEHAPSPGGGGEWSAREAIHEYVARLNAGRGR
jgi:hypothetical protein